MWNIKVDVTKENINRACERNSHACMVADAIRDRLKWATFIQVDTQSIRFNNRKQGKRWIFLTPPAAQKAIVLFDQGVKVRPFEFTLCQGQVRTMRAKHKPAKRSSRSYKKRNPSKHTPTMLREFGLRTMVR